MATANREEIETFMSITGVSEAIAVQKLEAYGGNLSEAINAHFSEDRNPAHEAPATMSAPPSDFMDIDDPPEIEHRDPSSLLSAARGLNPFSLLDPAFRRNLLDDRSLFDSSSGLMGRAPVVSQPREVREISVEVKDGHDNIAGHSGHAPRIENVTGTLQRQRRQAHGTVVFSDDDDDSITGNLGGNQVSARDNGPSAPQFDDTAVYENDIEEEMIRAAIEASKRDAELQNKQDLHDVGPVEMPSKHTDADLDHAVSLSLKTAEQEKLQREHSLKARASGSSSDKSVGMEKLGKIDRPTGRRQGVGEEEVSPVLSPSRSTVASQALPNGSAFHAHEWGGLSSEEHDEAVMLEAAMFGGVPESGYRAPYAPHQLMGSGLDIWRTPRPPSPSLVAQRSIREQQDDEYHAALQADREKALRAEQEEKAAKEAALQEQRQKEEESRRKLEAEQELERQLAAKETSLPEEPSLDDQNAVTLLVRMPDGSRHGRRFRKTDKLQSLFDFIDIGRGVKPGTYRLVRPYPRQAFGAEESNLTLNELGLTSKQEALFLELA